MNKSVYSLVLTDGVVEKIDALAYAQNTSRSNMINGILADYVSYTTPEKRMREVFETVESLLTGGENFQVLLQPSESMFSLRSALAYKYNPNVRYSVELYRDSLPELGELRVSLRSQNSALMLYLMQFFKLFTKVEQSFVGKTDCLMEDSRYIRKLILRTPALPSNEALGRAIGDYIELFDGCMKEFFSLLNDPAAAVLAVERRYAAYVHAHSIIL